MAVRRLTRLDVLALHAPAMIQSRDVPSTLRDESLLEGAIARPQMAEDYESADVFRQAAVLITGIAQAQAYSDGTKRTGLYCGTIFLRRNGFKLTAPQLVAETLVELGKQRISMERADSMIAIHLRESCIPQEP